MNIVNFHFLRTQAACKVLVHFKRLMAIMELSKRELTVGWRGLSMGLCFGGENRQDAIRLADLLSGPAGLRTALQV